MGKDWSIQKAEALESGGDDAQLIQLQNITAEFQREFETGRGKNQQVPNLETIPRRNRIHDAHPYSNLMISVTERYGNVVPVCPDIGGFRPELHGIQYYGCKPERSPNPNARAGRSPELPSERAYLIGPRAVVTGFVVAPITKHIPPGWVYVIEHDLNVSCKWCMDKGREWDTNDKVVDFWLRHGVMETKAD